MRRVSGLGLARAPIGLDWRTIFGPHISGMQTAP